VAQTDERIFAGTDALPDNALRVSFSCSHLSNMAVIPTVRVAFLPGIQEKTGKGKDSAISQAGVKEQRPGRPPRPEGGQVKARRCDGMPVSAAPGKSPGVADPKQHRNL
jgi:hypothetical protein